MFLGVGSATRTAAFTFGQVISFHHRLMLKFCLLLGTEPLGTPLERYTEHTNLNPHLLSHDRPPFSIAASVADYLVHYIDPVKPAVLDKPLKSVLPDLLIEWDKDYVYKRLFKDGGEAPLFSLFLPHSLPSSQLTAF